MRSAVFLALLSLVVCFVSVIAAIPVVPFSFADIHQADLVKRLSDYDVVVPRKVSERGQLLSHQLTHHYDDASRRQRRRRRQVDDASDDVHYRLELSGREKQLHLKPNDRLLASAFVVERRQGRNVTNHRLMSARHKQCHYIGQVKGHPESTVAVSTCNGLTGYVAIGGEEYMIEPIKGHPNASADDADQRFGQHQREHPHLIYKRSALNAADEKTDDDDGHGTCGNDESVELAFRQREKWQESQAEPKERGQHAIRKRSVSLERNVETLVVADQKMTEFYSNEDIETYILTVMNMVSALYRDASIGNAINIVMVRLMLLENESLEDGLDISHHADNTLKSFCKWQATINPETDDHPNHHDVAILLTRYNICTRVNEPCSTLGLAEVAGMCQSYRSCSVNEDTGLSLAYTVAHELGHNFGANHDGPTNGCEPLSGDQHVMSPQLSSDAGPIIWSNCSRKDITRFLDRNWGTCLEDPPSDHEFHYPELPPGAMYNVDHQCRLQYGPEAMHCSGMDEVCQTLWCKLPDNRCVTRLEPAAPGTSCAKHKWCSNGQCVQMGDRPQLIDGEWGEWGPWSDCTRTCGAGLASSARLCDNPAPAHGGKYCVGERRRYRVCNLDPCPADGPSYRAVQCSVFDATPYKGENHTWLPVQIKSAPCQLHCKPEGQFYSVMLSDSVVDGTPCNPGTRDMCINGVCRRVACDWGIDSKAQEDRCGVCHGDGTQCNTIRGNYTEPDGIDYVEMVVIPKGARNIRLIEADEAANYIAIQSVETNEYYLNGQWTVQWSGEYRAGFTLIYYRREGELEEVHIPGPSLEDLRFLLLFRAPNAGVSYEYTVANENITRTPEFRWEYMDWSVCTATCGGGTQVSQPKCMEKEAGLVEETYCAALAKPEEKSRACNKQSCPPRWWVGPWQHCSITCGKGRGLRRRTVICVRSLSDDEQMALHDADCPVTDRPTEEDVCEPLAPCPGEASWETGTWSKCNEDPCDVQRREVRCSVVGGACVPALKPAEERQCGNVVCGNWTIGTWSECSSSCGDGVQFRRVFCDGGLKCRDLLEPESIQKCRGLCLNAEISGDTFNSTTDVNTTSNPQTASPHLIEPEINNEILNLLIPSAVPSTVGVSNDRRPDFYVEDKILPENLKIMEMQVVTANPLASARPELDTNDVELADEAYLGHSYKKMSIHIGDDAALFLAKIQVQSDQPNDSKSSIDVSKIKPTFKWKIGLWTRCSVRCDGGTRVRDVSCYETTTSTLVDDALCTDFKPDDVESCNENPCMEWVLTPWSPCSSTCGSGVKKRDVRCPEQDMCNPDSRPNESMNCTERPCIDWVPGPWSICSATCGGGHQFRAAQCMDRRTSSPTEGCDALEKPRQRQRCANDPCSRSHHSQHSIQNEVKERQRACQDKLDSKLCASLKHMCGIYYFKVSKCCRTCRKYTSTHQSH
uniref:A disintegrin and metalloproteinase with thrombospondin motifs n=3 Tax=Daphnia magna TaxID=35525 RepID=A0A0P5WCA6_9CRUS